MNDSSVDNVEGEIFESKSECRKRKAMDDCDDEITKRQRISHSEDADQPGTSTRTSQNKNDDENSSNSSIGNSSSENSKESLNTKFRRGEDIPSDLDLGSNDGSADTEGSNDNNDDEDDGDWNMMGAALEREFLGME